MRESGVGIDEFFFGHRGGHGAEGDLAVALAGYDGDAGHPCWEEPAPQTMLIDDVEAIWGAIAERDDWAPLHTKLAALRLMGDALGEPPLPAGQGD